jgi:hypothetical protein
MLAIVAIFKFFLGYLASKGNQAWKQFSKEQFCFFKEQSILWLYCVWTETDYQNITWVKIKLKVKNGKVANEVVEIVYCTCFSS